MNCPAPIGILAIAPYPWSWSPFARTPGKTTRMLTHSDLAFSERVTALMVTAFSFLLSAVQGWSPGLSFPV